MYACRRRAAGSSSDEEEGADKAGLLLQGEHGAGHALYEVQLPSVTSLHVKGSRQSERVQQEGPSIRATGDEQDVADLLACIASKQWLQAALLLA